MLLSMDNHEEGTSTHAETFLQRLILNARLGREPDFPSSLF